MEEETNEKLTARSEREGGKVHIMLFMLRKKVLFLFLLCVDRETSGLNVHLFQETVSICIFGSFLFEANNAYPLPCVHSKNTRRQSPNSLISSLILVSHHVALLLHPSFVPLSLSPILSPSSTLSTLYIYCSVTHTHRWSTTLVSDNSFSFWWWWSEFWGRRGIWTAIQADTNRETEIYGWMKRKIEERKNFYDFREELEKERQTWEFEFRSHFLHRFIPLSPLSLSPFFSWRRTYLVVFRHSMRNRSGEK